MIDAAQATATGTPFTAGQLLAALIAVVGAVWLSLRWAASKVFDTLVEVRDTVRETTQLLHAKPDGLVWKVEKHGERLTMVESDIALQKQQWEEIGKTASAALQEMVALQQQLHHKAGRRSGRHP
jgi:hypothetical protein